MYVDLKTEYKSEQLQNKINDSIQLEDSRTIFIPRRKRDAYVQTECKE